MDSYIPYLIVCPLVFLAGFVDAVGGGGGLVSLPAYLLAGVPIHNAIATNKLSSVVGMAVSTLRFWRNRYVDMLFILPSVAAALIGSAIGAWVMLRMDAAIMQWLLLPILPLAAYYVFRSKTIDESKINSIPRRKAMLLAVAISLAVGWYDGFYGPGAGTFLLVLYISVCKLDVRAAAGNAKMVNLASNLAAFVTFLFSGALFVQLGLVAGIFSVLGHYVGAGLAIKKGYRIVRPIVLTVLTLLFIRIVFFEIVAP